MNALQLLGTLLLAASLVAAIAEIEEFVRKWLWWRRIQ